MTYDSPYRDATLVSLTANGGYHDVISENEADDRVMSSAAYDVVDRMCMNWFTRPDAVSCTLDVEGQVLEVDIISPCGNDIFAEFKLPFAELVLSAAHHCEDYEGVSPSEVSAMLRKLADEIDKVQEA